MSPDPKCCNGVTCHLLQVVSLVLGVQTQSVAMVWPVICYKWCHLYWGSRPKVLQWCDLSFVTSGVTCTGGPDPKCCNGVTCHLLQVVSLVLGVQTQSVAMVWPVICYKWCHLYWGSRPKVLQWCDLSFVTSGVTCTGGPVPKCCCALFVFCPVQTQSTEMVWPVISHLLWCCFSCTGGSSPKVLCLKGTYSAGTGEDSITACVVSWMFLLKAILCLCNDNVMLHFRLAYLKKCWLLKKYVTQ